MTMLHKLFKFGMYLYPMALSDVSNLDFKGKKSNSIIVATLFCGCATLQLHWFGLGAKNIRKHVHSAQRKEGRSQHR